MLESYSGYWYPLVFVSVFLILSFIVYILSRVFFSSAHKKGEQAKPFLSGNKETEKVHIPASSIYWGFIKALRGYYDVIIPFHTGNINDYMGAFIIVLAIVLTVVEVLT